VVIRVVEIPVVANRALWILAVGIRAVATRAVAIRVAATRVAGTRAVGIRVAGTRAVGFARTTNSICPARCTCNSALSMTGQPTTWLVQ